MRQSVALWNVQDSECGLLCNGGHINVVKDNSGTLSAQLQRNDLEIRLCSRFHNLPAGQSASGESNLSDFRVLAHRLTYGVT